MKLEEGKFYLNGFGVGVGPMDSSTDKEYPFFDSITGNSYTQAGLYDAWESSARDLIEEVPGKVVTLYCGETGEWFASESPLNTDTLKITFNVIREEADPLSVRMKLI